MKENRISVDGSHSYTPFTGFKDTNPKWAPVLRPTNHIQKAYEKQENANLDHIQKANEKLEKAKFDHLNIEAEIVSLKCIKELPSIDNVIYILQQCRKKKKLGLAKSMYLHLCNNGLENHREIGNYLVPMFVECGGGKMAEQVLNRVTHRNEHSWTSIIQNSIENGDPMDGVSLFAKMQQDCIPPSPHTLVALLKACTRLRDLQRGQDIYNEVIRQGVESDKYIGNTLVMMYAKCGAIAEARDVFDKLSIKDVVSWTALISSYAEYGLNNEALNCLNQMREEGISPDSITLVCCLKVCGNMRDEDKGRHIHCELVIDGFERDVSIGNTLVDMYAKCGLLVEAYEVFNELTLKDVVSWNVLILGYVECGLGVEALVLLNEMQSEGVTLDDVTYIAGLKACGIAGAIHTCQELHAEIAKGEYVNNPMVINTLVGMYAKFGLFSEAQDTLNEFQARDVVTWNSLISGYAEHGYGEAAFDCLKCMESQGVSPDAISFICTLKACGSITSFDMGFQLHSHIVMKGFESDSSVANTLLDMYAKCSYFSEAQKILDTLSVRDVVSWTALIAAFSEQKLVNNVVKCLQKMRDEGVYLNELTFSCSLKAFGNAGDIERGQEIHNEIIEEGLENVTLVSNALMDMYFKCGLPLEAKDVFDELLVRDVISWTTLVSGYADQQLGEEASSLLDRMYTEGICPNIVTYASVLKACSSSGAMEKGQELHTRMVLLGLEKDSFIGNTFIDMYAKWGMLTEARDIFENLSSRDVVSFNALMTGYSDHGLDENIMNCYAEMKAHNISPNVITFICILRSCANLGNITLGREIYMEISKLSLEQEVFIGNTLIDLYVKCGSIAEAKEIFDSLTERDLVSWTILITGYADLELVEECMECLKEMELEGILPDEIAFLGCLKACGNTQSLEKGQEIHAKLARDSLENDLLIGSSLIDMYAKCASLKDAEDVFLHLPIKDIVPWNALIQAYVDQGHNEHALRVLTNMQSKGLSPDGVTLSHALKACGVMKDINMGRGLHLEVVKKGYEKDNLVCNALVGMYAKFGSFAESEVLFDESIVQDEVTWNVLLSAYAENGLPDEALNCLSNMELDGISPNVISWSATISAYAEHGESKKALSLFRQMQEQAVLPNNITFLNFLKVCSKAADSETGKMIHSLITTFGKLEGTFVTTLIDMYGKCGCMDDAHQVFDQTEMEVEAWNALIAGYARQGESELTFALFERMRKVVKPDEVTFLTILTLCTHAGLVEKGLEYFKDMIIEHRISPNTKHRNCIVDLLSRAGQLDEAILMMRETPFRSDLAMWSIVLAACKKWGNVELGKYAFECVMDLDENHATAFVMLSNIYADVEPMEDGK